MASVPKKAFVLAAGLGERMRPLTNNCPKPLIEVDGITMLDRALDALAAVGVEEAVVNTYYLGHMIEDHLKNRSTPKITLSHETELLDTGGGVKKIISFFGDEPFYVLNGDIVVTDGKENSLQALAQKWDSTKMDLLLLLYPSDAKGDYFMPEGSDVPQFAKGTGKTANYIFAGPRIVHPRLFTGAKDGKFSFLELFHKAESAGKLYGLRHTGGWYHVGTPEALAETNAILSKKKAV